MKRTAILATLLVLLTTSVTAVEGYEGPKDQMHIMSSGSSSASKAVNQNGTMWSSEFSTVNKTAWTSESREEVFDGEFSNHTFSFRGVIQAPNPCYNGEAEVKETGNNTYRYTVNLTRTEGQTCTQQLVALEYEGSFSTDHPFKIVIYHEDQRIDSFESPDFGNGEESKDDGENETGGFLNRIISWLGSLF